MDNVKTVYHPTNTVCKEGVGVGRGHYNQGMANFLNFCTPKSLNKMAYANSADPDQTALDHSLSCFGFFVLSCLIIYQKAVIILWGYPISTAYGTSCLGSHA